jgi:uncharacterized protein YdiU (UPF0061 family)
MDGRAALIDPRIPVQRGDASLGVPTTRALSLVGTGEDVVRDMFYDGHPRAGPVPSYAGSRRRSCASVRSNCRPRAVKRPAAAAGGCLHRPRLPELQGQGEALYGDWFAQIAVRTAEMIAHWMRVGFVHGVMNTDNLSVLGCDAGLRPYGWVEDFDPDWTPNTTDAQGRRYRFGTSRRWRTGT